METEEKALEGNKLIADFVGLKVKWFNSPGWGGEAGDWDMELQFPDFFDHDEQLMYLYDTEIPQENFKFNSDWNWLMGAVAKIKFSPVGDDWTNSSLIADAHLFYWDRIKDALTTVTITVVFNAVVDYVKWFNKFNPKTPD